MIRLVKLRWTGGATLQFMGGPSGHIRAYDKEEENIADNLVHENARMVVEAATENIYEWFWATTKVARVLAPALMLGSKGRSMDRNTGDGNPIRFRPIDAGAIKQLEQAS